jgi:hypothetical protein
MFEPVSSDCTIATGALGSDQNRVDLAVGSTADPCLGACQSHRRCRKRCLVDDAAGPGFDDGVAVRCGVRVDAADESVVVCDDGQCGVLLKPGWTS